MASDEQGAAEAKGSNDSKAGDKGLRRIPVVECCHSTDSEDEELEVLGFSEVARQVDQPEPVQQQQTAQQKEEEKEEEEGKETEEEQEPLVLSLVEQLQSLAAAQRQAAGTAAEAAATEAAARAAKEQAQQLRAAAEAELDAAAGANAARAEAQHRVTVVFCGGGAEGGALLGTAEFDAAVQRLKDQGNEAFREGDYSSAARLFGRALQLAPDTAALWSNRALAHLKVGLCVFILCVDRSAVLVGVFVKEGVEAFVQLSYTNPN